MTIGEVSEKYNIPLEVLKEYREWGLCDEVKKIMGIWQYDDTDLERLSMIMTLHDIGFANEEVKTYMQLYLNGKDTEVERLRMLNELRSSALNEIHLKEKQLERMDYLRYKIKRDNNNSQDDKQ